MSIKKAQYCYKHRTFIFSFLLFQIIARFFIWKLTCNPTSTEILFFEGPKALAKKRLGVEGGLSCPNNTLIN
ncbi:hypothetical protein HY04_07215 [Kaistella antarctica]|uniref:Uncharacterized protein n=1 Tax=Kaistella antarctica TaxID=266748 RepID=A0ABR4TWG3_9FLAO|nr:hypothetical protein HY04_07215 [Kaistella antarctica]